MLKDTLLVTICLILSSVLGFIAQIVFASSFGASAQMDIYFNILSVPELPPPVGELVLHTLIMPRPDLLEILFILFTHWRRVSK